MQGIRRLPRYRDPITRNVARLLRRGLQEQHRAPSSTAVEFEVRCGRLSGFHNSRRRDFPIAIATPAIIDSVDASHIAFEAGVDRVVAAAMELALFEAGFLTRNALARPFPDFTNQDASVMLENGKRLACDFEVESDLKRRAVRRQLQQQQKHARQGEENDGSASSASFAGPSSALHNPYAFDCALVVQSALVKKKMAMFDMCGAGWTTDLRFTVAAETKVPVTKQDISAVVPEAVRYRNRIAVSVPPFFRIHISRCTWSHDLWWYPSLLQVKVEDASWETEEARPSAAGGTPFDAVPYTPVIPCPGLFRQRGRGVSSTDGRQSPQNHYFKPALTLDTEVEVEVDMPALLKVWKKQYGGAAASAYLGLAEPLHTTAAGTTMGTSKTFVETPVKEHEYTKNEGSYSSTNTVGPPASSEKEVQAYVLAEREDPLLWRVAEDYMALLQFLTKLRVLE